MWLYMPIFYLRPVVTQEKLMFVLRPVRPNQKKGTRWRRRWSAAPFPRPLSWEDQGVVLWRTSLWRTLTHFHRASTKFTFSFTKTSPRFVTTMQDAIHLWVDRRCFKIRFCKACRATVIKGGMLPHILEKLPGDTRDYRQTLTISYHNFCCIGFSHYILRRSEEEPESLKHLCASRYWMWLNCFAGTQSASCAMQMPR